MMAGQPIPGIGTMRSAMPTGEELFAEAEACVDRHGTSLFNFSWHAFDRDNALRSIRQAAFPKAGTVATVRRLIDDMDAGRVRLPEAGKAGPLPKSRRLLPHDGSTLRHNEIERRRHQSRAKHDAELAAMRRGPSPTAMILETEALRDPAVAMADLRLRWSDDWARVVALAKSEALLPAEMLARIVCAGLDTMEAER